MGGDCRRDDRNTPAARGVQHRQEHGWTVEARASAASGDDEGGPRHLPSEVMGFLGHDQLEGRGLWRAATKRSECCNGGLLALAAGGATGKQWDNSSPIVARVGVMACSDLKLLGLTVWARRLGGCDGCYCSRGLKTQ